MSTVRWITVNENGKAKQKVFHSMKSPDYCPRLFFGLLFLKFGCDRFETYEMTKTWHNHIYSAKVNITAQFRGIPKATKFSWKNLLCFTNFVLGTNIPV